MIDQEAQEKIAELLYADGDSLPVEGWKYLNQFGKDAHRLRAKQILNILEELGYRKLPEGIYGMNGIKLSMDSDIKWYEE